VLGTCFELGLKYMYVEVRTHRTNRLDKRINTIRHTQVEKTRITERLLVPFRSNLIYIGTQLIERSARSFVYNPQRSNLTIVNTEKILPYAEQLPIMDDRKMHMELLLPSSRSVFPSLHSCSLSFAKLTVPPHRPLANHPTSYLQPQCLQVYSRSASSPNHQQQDQT
jgi:hypothetical protein